MSTHRNQPTWQVAECLLPGVTPAVAQALAQRVGEEIGDSPSPEVSLLGVLLIPEDEVLLCVFTGPAGAVRAVSERAQLPLDRIVSCVGLGWPTRLEGDHT